MGVYDFLVTTYSTFINLFPAPIQWLVTLLVVIGIIAALVGALRHHWLFLIVLIVLLPFLIPALSRLLAELYDFVMYLLGVLRLTAPKS